MDSHESRKTVLGFCLSVRCVNEWRSGDGDRLVRISENKGEEGDTVWVFGTFLGLLKRKTHRNNNPFLKGGLIRNHRNFERTKNKIFD